ncbi:probable alkaline/neutral invertase F isoform X2 [Eucalyptus grandis]|uniref:probable alkaline/neutral invertase F isoform X2 n=1 Tax=Eucalyptus grandis TaxID=71139 RepID=UPI00192ED5C1|nr:probable alkaline/neutral invertase F isoform X2 [Eucalyptus grandis]
MTAPLESVPFGFSVFVRDFVPSGLACLMKKEMEPEIVKNFLLRTLHPKAGKRESITSLLEKESCLRASKSVLTCKTKKERLVADFGGSAIGRVAPVDSGFWWIILTKCAHDYSLADLPVVQKGMKLILILCLSYGFDTFPTLLCADGCSMIEKEWRVFSSFFFLSFIELKLVKMAARMLGISEELRIHF